MKVLVTGGCGFIGSNLVLHALQNKDHVWVLDALIRSGSEQNLSWLQTQGDFEFIKGSVADEGLVESLIKRVQPDVVFHVAGQVSMEKSLQNPKEDFQVNAYGTLTILEALRRHSPHTLIVFSSTNKVYGELAWIKTEEKQTRYWTPDFPMGFDERLPLCFETPYGCSKGAADQYLLDYARVYGIKTVVFRHSSVYGGRQFASIDQGWIGWFCKKMLEFKSGQLTDPITIQGNGKQVRDVTYVSDVVSLYFKAAQHPEALIGQVFNIGSGMQNSLSILELFSYLETHYGQRIHYRELPERSRDQRVFVADTTKIQTALGWYPQVTKEEGIDRLIHWTQSLQNG